MILGEAMRQQAVIIDAEYAEIDGEENAAAENARLHEAFATFVDAHEREAERRVGRRINIERRWLEDMRQYHGRYEDEVYQELKREARSQLFINVTRSKTNAAEARLSDMMFPVDDKNWGIEPTPVPSLSRDAGMAADQAASLVDQANAALQAGDEAQAEMLAMQAQMPAARASKARAQMDEAKRRAQAMEEEIEDQLRECRYAAHVRDAVREACMLGTGIIKGPIISEEPRRQWTDYRTQDGRVVQVLETSPSQRASFQHVSCWNLFPDPDATKPEHSDGWYERALMKPRDLRKLAKLPGIDRKALRQLLTEKPRQSVPYYVADMRAITGIADMGMGECYHVWYFYGSITADELRDVAMALGKDGMADDYADADPLDEIHVCMMFCQGHLLKFAEHPMDTGESIYSMFCYEKDDASLWGYGVPYMMRDQQKALNAAWRMLMDNAGLSSGPQILMDKGALEPADGSWQLRPRKIWHVTRQRVPGDPPLMETFEINSHQAELMAIIELARKMIDDETGITQLAEGQQGTSVTKTAQGMAMLMNSTNIVFKRIVKNFDDDMTIPTIRRAYHWNMQFPSSEDIVGDCEIVARGSSVLLVRELQAQNLLALANNWTVHPVYGPMMKAAQLGRETVKANMISADDVMLTDEEIEEQQRRMAEQPPPPDIEMVKLQTQERIAQLESETRITVANTQRETALISLAEQHNMKLEELETRLQINRDNNASRERGMAVEVAMREATGESAGGAV